MEQAELIIDHAPVVLHCRACQKKFSPDPFSMFCLLCGGVAVEILSGRELMMTALEVV